jgi:hypothetical protein
MTRFAKRGVKFLGLTTLFVATLELCARIDDCVTWDAPFWGPYDHSILYIRDEFGKHGRPNAQFEKWKLNQFGFRGPEITQAKPAGVYRIAIMGASETFGQAESPGKEYPAQVQEILDRAQPGRYEVLNTAVPGMSLPRISEFLSDYVYRFEPDLLILYPVAVDHLDFVCPEPRKGPLSPAPKPRDPEVSLRLARRVKAAIKQNMPGPVMNYVRKHMRDRALRRYGISEPWQVPPHERVSAYEDHLLAVINEASRHGIDVLLATHANRFGETRTDLDRRWLIAWQRFYPLATGECLIQMENRANEIIRRAAMERQLHLADLAATVPPGSESFSDFVHFTDDGARVAAETLVAEILAIVNERK